MSKIITWVDLQGRYRKTDIGYDTIFRLHGLTGDEAAEFAWARIVAAETRAVDSDGFLAYDSSGNPLPNVSKYGITIDHPHFLVEDVDYAARLKECCGNYFRSGVFMLPNREGLRDANGEVRQTRDHRDGAWEMDTGGLPKVNMPKARGVQMDNIRVVRNSELVKEDLNILKAIEAGDSSEQDAVKTKKQTLRGIPQTFDLTTDNDTPEELKAKWPSELPARE